MAKKYDFTAFIRDNQKLIFGNDRVNYSEKYKKNIAALDLQMNQLLESGNELKEDPRLLLGLFDLSIQQFGHFVKTDLKRYQDSFFAFLDLEMPKAD